jgi:hypothetical protein
MHSMGSVKMKILLCNVWHSWCTSLTNNTIRSETATNTSWNNLQRNIFRAFQNTFNGICQKLRFFYVRYGIPDIQVWLIIL